MTSKYQASWLGGLNSCDDSFSQEKIKRKKLKKFFVLFHFFFPLRNADFKEKNSKNPENSEINFSRRKNFVQTNLFFFFLNLQQPANISLKMQIIKFLQFFCSRIHQYTEKVFRI